MPNEMLDDKGGGMVDDMTGALVPTDPTAAALGFEALREFLIEVSAEEGACQKVCVRGIA